MRRIGSYWLWIISIGFLIVFPLAFPSAFYINTAIDFLIASLFGVSLNLLVGYTGLLSLGHNAFLGIGSYAMGILLRQTSLGIPMTLVSLMALAAIFGLFMGYFCTRLTKFYFGFLSVALSQVIYFIVIRWTSVTGGYQGLIGGIPTPPIHLFGWSIDIGTRLHLYYFAVFLVCGSFMLCKAIVNSPFGWVLRSIRENPLRAQFVGINARRYQIGVFVISGVFGALAGGLTALNVSGAYPEHADFLKGIDPVFAILIGGMNNFFGPVVGAGVMTFLNIFLSTHTRYLQFFLGVALILIVMLFRVGLLDFLVHRIGIVKGVGNRMRGLICNTGRNEST